MAQLRSRPINQDWSSDDDSVTHTQRWPPLTRMASCDSTSDFESSRASCDRRGETWPFAALALSGKMQDSGANTATLSHRVGKLLPTGRRYSGKRGWARGAVVCASLLAVLLCCASSSSPSREPAKAVSLAEEDALSRAQARGSAAWSTAGCLAVSLVGACGTMWCCPCGVDELKGNIETLQDDIRHSEMEWGKERIELEASLLTQKASFAARDAETVELSRKISELDAEGVDLKARASTEAQRADRLGEQLEAAEASLLAAAEAERSLEETLTWKERKLAESLKLVEEKKLVEKKKRDELKGQREGLRAQFSAAQRELEMLKARNTGRSAPRYAKRCPHAALCEQFLTSDQTIFNEGVKEPKQALSADLDLEPHRHFCTWRPECYAKERRSDIGLDRHVEFHRTLEAGYPQGWSMFGVPLNEKMMEKNKVLETWKVAYHGTRCALIPNILARGTELLFSGDRTHTGFELSPPAHHIPLTSAGKMIDGVAFEPRAAYASRSWKYAGSETYATVGRVDMGAKGKFNFQCMLETRWDPKATSTRPGTTPPWQGDLDLEYFTSRRGAHVITGIWVRAEARDHRGARYFQDPGTCEEVKEGRV